MKKFYLNIESDIDKSFLEEEGRNVLAGADALPLERFTIYSS